jgi:hypothetical protein
VVLSADEVVRFLEAVPSLKSRAALTTAYAAGLRASAPICRSWLRSSRSTIPKVCSGSIRIFAPPREPPQLDRGIIRGEIPP